MGGVFIDFQKAFDTVSHDILAFKLQALGRVGNAFELIMSYLNNRHQYTELNGRKSETKAIKYGVPQGSLLEPRLFGVQVNDMPESIDEGEQSLFADDTSAYCFGKNLAEVIDILNHIMGQVHKWCTRNKMYVHPGKSNAMIIKKTPFIGPLRPIYFGNDVISFATKADCLGLTIDKQLSWSIQINHACKSCSKKVSALKRMKYLPKKVLEELYYKTVIPAVAYCIAVWGNCSTSLFQNIEKVHARAARVIYDLPSQTSAEDSLMHARWQSISYIYKRRLLCIMHTIYYETAHHSIKKLFTKKSTSSIGTRNRMKFEVKRFKSAIGINSLQYRGTVLWNSMPDELKQIDNLNTFKRKLKTRLNEINNFRFETKAILIKNKKDIFIYR